jgi:hypothetical protein
MRRQRQGEGIDYRIHDDRPSFVGQGFRKGWDYYR